MAKYYGGQAGQVVADYFAQRNAPPPFAGVNDPRWEQAKPGLPEAPGTQPGVQPAVSAQTTFSNTWGMNRLGSLYGILHSDQKPVDIPEELVGLVDSAYNYQQKTGTDELPIEYATLLDELFGDFQPPAVEAQEDWVPSASEPNLNYTRYGMTPEQWESLQPWQRTSMNVMGSKPMAGFTSALGWAEEKIPFWNQAMSALDWLARNVVKRPAGLVELAQSDEVDIQDILDNLDNAWTAAEQVYRATPLQSLLPDAWEQPLGVGETPEAWKFGTTESAQLEKEQYGPDALAEYFQRLNKGEQVADLNAEFEQRYGYQGMMRDMVGMMVADPLNILGAGIAKGAASGIKAGLKGTSIAQDATKMARLTSSLDKSSGLVRTLKRFTAAASQVLTPEEWDELPRLLKAITKPFDQPYTKSGANKLLASHKRGFFHPTAVTDANRALNVNVNTSHEVFQRFGTADEGIAKLDKFLGAVDANRIDEMSDLSMKLTDGADFGVHLAFLKDDAGSGLSHLNKYRKMLQDYGLTKETRKMWDDVVQATGTNSDDLLKALTDERTAARTAADIVARLGPDANVTEDALLTAAKYFNSANGAIDGRQLLGKLFATQTVDMAKWAAKYFNVGPDKGWVKWSNLVKAMQGMVLLDLNPTYLLQNILDNQFKLLREGMAFGSGGSLYIPGRVEKLTKRIFPNGVPERFAAGFGGEYGTQAMNPIKAAQKSKVPGLAETATEAVGKARKILPGQYIAGGFEQRQRQFGNLAEYMKAWRTSWSEGKGFPKVSAELAQGLPPGFERKMYDLIKSRMTHDELYEAMEGLLKGEIVDNLEMTIDGTLRGMGFGAGSVYGIKDALLKMGLDDYLEANLKIGMSSDDVGNVFREVHKMAEKQLNEWHKIEKARRLEEAAAIGKREGILGAANQLYEAMNKRTDQRLMDWRGWDHVAEYRSSPIYPVLIEQMIEGTRGAYRRLEESIQATYDGLVKAFGKDSDVGAFFAQNLGDDFRLWKEFFDTKNKKMREFFKAHNNDNWDDARWMQLNDEMEDLYNVAYTDSLRLLGERNEKIRGLFVAYAGDEFAPLVDDWVARTTALEQGLFDEMAAFRQRLKSIKGADARHAAWEEFLPGFKKKIVERQVENTTALRDIQVKANDLVKTGKIPVQPEIPDPIGTAPVGSVKGLSSYPDYGEMFTQGWNEYILPFLNQLEVNYAGLPRKTNYGTLTGEQIRGLKQYAEDVASGMSDTRLASTKYASIATDAAMLDYNRRYGFDEVLGAVFPYQFWFTRSAMNWALSSIDHPAWYAQWHRLREMQDKLATDQEGFPSRLAGKMQIHVPFMPEGWGSSLFVDPLHQMFGFEGMAAQMLRPLQRDQMNIEGRAEYILETMERDGDITQEEMARAINSKGTDVEDPLWIQAMSQASQEVDKEIGNPIDMVSTILSPSLPIQWALERMGIVNERNRGAGTWPIASTFQGITSFITPGGINLYEKFQNVIGAAQGEQTQNARGFLWDYYVARELSNMAVMGADPEAVKLAMVEKQGPLYEQAIDTIGKQQAVRSFASILWTDFFPEGEQKLRALQPEFEKAAAAGKLTEFFDKYPEYEARLQRNDWDDPDAMMSRFLRSSIWDAYLGMDKMEQEAARESFGDLFTENFLSKETRSYDSINLDTYVQWARALNGVVPENAPEVQPVSVDYPEARVNQKYNEYVVWRDAQPGYALSNAYYGLPPAMQEQFRLQHPEVVQYQEAKYRWLNDNPEMIPYVLSEENELQNVPIEVAMEVMAFRAEKATYFPLVGLKQDYYYTLDKKGQREYLKANPDLKAYWDWNRARSEELSAPAYYLVKGEYGLDKLRGKEAEYEVDYTKFSPQLTYALARSTLLGKSLDAGAKALLYTMWESEGKPMASFEAWTRTVLDAFDYVP